MTEILKYFKEISEIPRESGNEDGICKYLEEFAAKHNLEYHKDEYKNVIIKKEASAGYENSKTIILQGHTDMVCVKTAKSSHDFEKEGIELVEESGYISGNQTSLGADNGIAIAYCLAILSNDKLKHPRLEVLLTSEEETTMGGAENLDPKYLDGKILINLDSEEEGIFLVSSAGGVEIGLKLPIKWDNLKDNYKSYRIKIKGLYGGHSGADIDKGRANSNKLMGRLLEGIGSKMSMELSEINGGTKPNVIPGETIAIVSIPSEEEGKLVDLISTFKGIYKNEFKVSEPKLDISYKCLSKPVEKVLDDESAKKAIVLFNLLPHGVQTMSMDIEGLVESSCNFAIVETNGKSIDCMISVRSSVETLRDEVVTRIDMVSDVMGGSIDIQSPYPAWQYKESSYIRDLMINVYENKYGEKPQIEAIHAGLECGMFDAKIDDLDAISIGPNIHDAHTVNERIEIESANKVYDYLLEVLSKIK
ncbi:MAG: aminoacyl-histidine dipeptidase [Tissierellales bacterium]|jgi:dipeptidase D|nr:aminoacyl-histidine dipeptidase [Tissierellales bacterium]